MLIYESLIIGPKPTPQRTNNGMETMEVNICRQMETKKNVGKHQQKVITMLEHHQTYAEDNA